MKKEVQPRVPTTLRGRDMSIDSSSFDASNALRLLATLNWPFGLWPLLKVDLNLKIRMTIGIVEMILMLTVTFHEIFQKCGNAEDSINNLLIITSGVLTLSKIIIYHINRDKLKANVVSALDDWSSSDATSCRSIMRSYERIYRNVTFLLVIFAVTSGISYFLKALVFDPDKMIPVKNDNQFTNVTQLVLQKRYVYPASCTLNNVSKWIHHALVLNQLIQLVTSCVVAIGSDAFFVTIALHLCGQLEILKIRFANIGKDKSPIVMENQDEVVILISRHQHLVHMTELLEDAYNKIVFIHLFICLILMTIAGFGFLLNLQTGDFAGSARSLIIVQCMLVQTFMYACIGESVHSHGDNITQSIYEASWYELPRSLTKSLIFVMMRSNVSPHLTAGKFLKMTHVTFMDVVKTSSSYLSVLRIMINE